MALALSGATATCATGVADDAPAGTILFVGSARSDVHLLASRDLPPGRYRRVDVGHMDLEITVEDPGAYTRPWKIRRLLRLAEGDDVQEFICENNRMEHYVAH